MFYFHLHCCHFLPASVSSEFAMRRARKREREKERKRERKKIDLIVNHRSVELIGVDRAKFVVKWL